jgi:hypothetical protein
MIAAEGVGSSLEKPSKGVEKTNQPNEFNTFYDYVYINKHIRYEPLVICCVFELFFTLKNDLRVSDDM